MKAGDFVELYSISREQWRYTLYKHKQKRSYILLLIAGSICAGLALLASLVDMRYLNVRSHGATASTESIQEAIRFEETSVELGRIPLGVRQKCQVWIHNTAAKSLRIKGITSSCKCNGKAVYPTENMEPGYRREIVLSLDPRVGQHAEPFALRSSNGEHSILRVVYEGFFDAFLEKRRLDVGRISSAMDTKVSMKVMGDTTAFSCKDVNTNIKFPPWMSVTIREPDRVAMQQLQSGKSDLTITGRAPFGVIACVDVVLKKGIPLGTFHEPIPLEIKGSNGARTLILQCIGQVFDEVYATPSPLVLLYSQDGKCSGTLKLQSLGRAFRIISVDSDILECNFDQREELCSNVAIHVSTDDKGVRTGGITIRIQHPVIAVIQVPVKLVWSFGSIEKQP